MIAHLVIDQHIRPRRHIAGQDVPAGDGQIVARVEDRHLRHPAGRNHHHIGVQRQDIGTVGQRVEPEFHVARRALRKPPVNDAPHLGPARGPGGKA